MNSCWPKHSILSVLLLGFFGFIAADLNAQLYSQRGERIKGTNSGDVNGNSIAFNAEGSILAVGSKFNDDFNWNAGKVRVYEWQDTAWVQLGQDLLGSWPWNGQFGKAIALNDSGNVLVVGEIGNGNLDPGGGAVKIFKWNGTSWNQLGNTLYGEFDYDSFGWSVACSSDGYTIALGTPHNYVGPFGSRAGHVRVFSWNGTAWSKKGSDIDGTVHGEQFGYDVDIDGNGNTLIIGAPQKTNAQFTGAVVAFTWNGNSWIQKGPLIGSPYSNARYGESVSISSDGNKIAVGAPNTSRLNKAQRGCFIMYEYITFSNGAFTWSQIGTTKWGKNSGDRLGTSVAMNSFGNYIIAGATQTDLFNSDSTKSGYALIYERANQNWQVVDSVKGEPGNEYFGSSVAINDFGNTVAVGAPESSNIIPPNFGYATVFAPTCSLNAAIYDSLGILVANKLNAKYQWYKCDSALVPLNGEKKRVFVPKESGEYTVVIRDSNCVDTAFCIPGLAIFGVEENLTHTSLEIFPNPTNSSCTIRFSENVNEVTIKLYSFQGMNLLEEFYNSTQEINLEFKAKTGVYILEIDVSGQKTTFHKIVKY